MNVNTRESQANFLDVLSRGSKTYGDGEEKEEEEEEREGIGRGILDQKKSKKYQKKNVLTTSNRGDEEKEKSSQNEDDNEDKNALKEYRKNRSDRKSFNVKPSYPSEGSWVDEKKNSEGRMRGSGREQAEIGSDRDGKREGDPYFDKQGTYEKGGKYSPVQNKVRYQEEKYCDEEKEVQMKREREMTKKRESEREMERDGERGSNRIHYDDNHNRKENLKASSFPKNSEGPDFDCDRYIYLKLLPFSSSPQSIILVIIYINIIIIIIISDIVIIDSIIYCRLCR